MFTGPLLGYLGIALLVAGGVFLIVVIGAFASWMNSGSH